MKKNEYNAKNLTVLEGLEAVRVRPGMYIGTTSEPGLHHILWEIIDNSVDEAANGYANKIIITLFKDGSASVEDNGRGIPTDIHPEKNVSGVELVFTQLHAGGKFNNENYEYSGGLHGVGASVTNALSKWLTVEVYKNETTYKMEFESYYDKTAKKVLSGIPKGPLENTGVNNHKKGTKVHFLPDSLVFGEHTFNYETIVSRLAEIACLNKNIQFVIHDERTGKKKSFKSEDGIVEFLKSVEGNHTPLYEKPIKLNGTYDGINIDIAIMHTTRTDEVLKSYVNNIPTKSGGKHEEGFHSALTKVLNEYARRSKILKEKDSNFLGDDFKEGLNVILSIKMSEAQFEGQTKDRLGSQSAKVAVENFVIEALTSLMKDKKMASTFQAIMKKAQLASSVRKAAKKAKELARATKEVDNFNLVGKLAACSGRKPELNELFIVEGDSAGGSAKQARVRQTQAILPLRGKPLNVEKKKYEQILQNEEIKTIISAIGAGAGAKFDIEEIKYHKVIILSDADQDGAHIRAILLTFFYRYMPDLIKNGHVYIGMPPLYKLEKKGEIEYAYDDSEYLIKKEKLGKNVLVQRYKGLGEMNPSQLWETTMNPETRMLMRVVVEDESDLENLIGILMGDRIEERKAYISSNANFNKEDAFLKEIER